MYAYMLPSFLENVTDQQRGPCEENGNHYTILKIHKLMFVVGIAMIFKPDVPGPGKSIVAISTGGVKKAQKSE